MQKRPTPYVWASWPCAILSGDAQCLYSIWVRAHFKLDLLDRGDFDLAAWKIQHAEMVEKRVAALRADGWTVTVEDENSFTLAGRAAKLAGKPDVVAVKDRDVLIVDQKSGKRSPSHIQQVLLYMFAWPLVRPQFKDYRIAGEVEYRDGAIPISPEQFSPELRARIVDTMTKLGSSIVPPTVPSARECAFCPVSKVDCPARIDAAVEAVTTEAF